MKMNVQILVLIEGLLQLLSTCKRSERTVESPNLSIVIFAFIKPYKNVNDLTITLLQQA